MEGFPLVHHVYRMVHFYFYNILFQRWKHKVLENELHEALVHLSTDDLQIVELKRRKLMVKDEIERLQGLDRTARGVDQRAALKAAVDHGMHVKALADGSFNISVLKGHRFEPVREPTERGQDRGAGEENQHGVRDGRGRVPGDTDRRPGARRAVEAGVGLCHWLSSRMPEIMRTAASAGRST